MRSTSGVPDLQKDPTSLGMNGISDFLPTFDLLLRVNTAGAWERSTLGNNLGAFSEIKPGQACSLGVILNVESVGNAG